MECSAKTNTNVKEVFKAFQQLAKIPLPSDEHGLRRRSSAQARVNNGKSRFSGNTTLSPHHSVNDPESVAGSSLAQRLKPRSRSLIRRTSKKASKIKEPTSDADDCAVSWGKRIVPILEAKGSRFFLRQKDCVFSSSKRIASFLQVKLNSNNNHFFFAKIFLAKFYLLLFVSWKWCQSKI